jgi:phosphoribosylanthranilate isomerase
MRDGRTLVKICGVCRVEDGAAAAAAGADLLGFHFCSSPRRITPALATSIIAGLPRRPRLVGVFIDQPPEEIDQIAAECGLDLAQLHGSEAPSIELTVPVMKVLKVRDGEVPDATAWPDPIMLDSWSPDQRGGTGRSWEWGRAADLVASRRVFIAGGLDPVKVGQVVLELQPHGVDVSSGVESAVGVKDEKLMKAFVEAVRDADGRAQG